MDRITPISTQLTIEKVDEYCSSLAQMGYLNGTVLVGLEGRILFSKGYGKANFEHEIPNETQTKFRIGSITKQFTAMAIMMMEEAGLLHVHDPISEYVPDYPNGDKITIHHLLTHSSGIPSFTSFPDYLEMMALPSSIPETVDRFSGKPLVFEPGEKFDYCNSGYLLLSHIIERVSNGTFEAYIEQEILKPLGLINTGHDHYKKILKNRASGYEMWGEILNATFIDMSIPSGAGAMYSTVEDLYIWTKALHSQSLMRKDSYEAMTSKQIDNYGYGIFIYEEEILNIPRKVIGHAGGVNGFLSECKYYSDEDLTVIVLTNMSTMQPGPISNRIARIALGEEVQLLVKYMAIEIDLDRIPDLPGKYEVKDDSGMVIVISAHDGKYYVSDEKTFKIQLCPYKLQDDAVHFFLKGMEGTGTFNPEPSSSPEIRFEVFGGVRNAVKIE
jgi:CubicO group peptidase (beta-lactamase class C family)